MITVSVGKQVSLEGFTKTWVESMFLMWRGWGSRSLDRRRRTRASRTGSVS